MKLKEFSIVYSHPRAVFSAGATMNGYVLIKLAEPLKLKVVKLQFYGQGKVHWSQYKYRSGGNSRWIDYRSQKVYCNHTLTLYGNTNNSSEMMPAGEQKLTFEVQLPAGLPSSFEGHHGQVRYYCSATIVRPWKFDHKCKEPFTVIHPLDLNREPENVSQSATGKRNTTVSCCCCVSGRVHAEYMVSKRGFVPGEPIPVSVVVENYSNAQVNSTKVLVVQQVDFYGVSNAIFSSGHPKPKRTELTVALREFDGVPPGETLVCNNVNLQLRALPPSRLDGCDFIDIKYFLKFKTSVEYGSDMEAIVEIIMGTVPLVQSSAPPAFDDIITTAGITAPSSPPPYTDIAPPSYEECVLGRVNIREDDDDEHTMGHLQWAPFYPVYHTAAAATVAQESVGRSAALTQQPRSNNPVNKNANKSVTSSANGEGNTRL